MKQNLAPNFHQLDQSKQKKQRRHETQNLTIFEIEIIHKVLIPEM
jgi:hypothetical protein